jgi:hypothetical protein
MQWILKLKLHLIAAWQRKTEGKEQQLSGHASLISRPSVEEYVEDGNE